MERQELITKIQSILNTELPEKCYREVKPFDGSFGGKYIAIKFAATDYDINHVKGQKPQAVSLCLDVKTLELTVQSYACCGGQNIYRKPDMNNNSEKYLAMAHIKIPFRKPKPEEKFILNAIQKFATNWVIAIKQNMDKLMYQEYVNYSELFS